MTNFKFMTYDVEHGSSHVLWLPNAAGDVMMFDAGSTGEFSPAWLLKHKYGVRQLRWLNISHQDSDHLTDISNIDEHTPPITLTRPKVSFDQIKEQHNGEIPTTVEIFYAFEQRFTLPCPPIEHPGYDWGGVQFARFENKISSLSRFNINNLSLATFVDYQGTTILLPGDLEREGWLLLLREENFRYWLQKVDILVASHHGRDSGFCPEIFGDGLCQPLITIISDKSTTETSVTDKYAAVSQGIMFTSSDRSVTPRKVLTTRSDGAILVEVDPEGRLSVTTKYQYL